MPYSIRNLAQRTHVLNLFDGNALTLLPRGCGITRADGSPADCGILTDDEVRCEDVLSLTRIEEVAVERLASTEPPEPQEAPPVDSEATDSRRSPRRRTP